MKAAQPHKRLLLNSTTIGRLHCKSTYWSTYMANLKDVDTL